MKLSLYRSIRPPSQVASVEDIDVTPVMNMFIILIPFLVSMAVFTRMSIIEFSLPPNVGVQMNQSQEKPVPKLTIRIGNDYLGIVLGEELLDSLPVSSGNFPMETLREQIRIRASLHGYSGEVVIASSDGVAFKQVVAVMDICRDAGLDKIGLSSATDNADALP